MANPSVDALSSAYYHTRRILFCPFEPRKYMKMALVYLLSGGMQGGPRGGSFNNYIPTPRSHHHSGIEGGITSMAQSCLSDAGSFIRARGSGESLQYFLNLVQIWKSRLDSIFHSNDTGLMALWSLGIFGVVVLVFGLIYMTSVFQFIFLESIVSNRLSIIEHWRKHKGLGFSYMLWMLVIMFVMIGMMAAFLVPVGMTAAASKGAPSGAFMGSLCAGMLAVLAVILVLSIVAALTINLVVPVMYIKNISILPAWGRVLKLARSHVGEFLLYCVVKVGLAVAFFIVAFIAMLLVVAVAALFFAFPAYLVYATVKGSPLAGSPGMIALAASWGALAVMFIIFLSSVMLLPAGVFLKSYNLCFLGMLDQEYRVMFAE